MYYNIYIKHNKTEHTYHNNIIDRRNLCGRRRLFIKIADQYKKKERIEEEAHALFSIDFNAIPTYTYIYLYLSVYENNI